MGDVVFLDITRRRRNGRGCEREKKAIYVRRGQDREMGWKSKVFGAGMDDVVRCVIVLQCKMPNTGCSPL